jgi:hypothetical protein
MPEQLEDASGGVTPEATLATIATQLVSLKRSIEQNNTISQVSERGKKARLQPGETLTGNGPLRGYNRTLTLVEELEAIERMLPAEGEPLSPEKVQDVHEAIKKGAFLLPIVLLCISLRLTRPLFQLSCPWAVMLRTYVADTFLSVD